MGLTYPGLFHTLLSLYYARNSEDYDNLLLPFTRIWRFSGVIVNLFKISRNLTHQGRTKLLGFFPRGSRKLIIKRKRATNQTKRMRSHRLNQKFSAFIARVKSKWYYSRKYVTHLENFRKKSESSSSTIRVDLSSSFLSFLVLIRYYLPLFDRHGKLKFKVSLSINYNFSMTIKTTMT